LQTSIACPLLGDHFMLRRHLLLERVHLFHNLRAHCLQGTGHGTSADGQRRRPRDTPPFPPNPFPPRPLRRPPLRPNTTYLQPHCNTLPSHSTWAFTHTLLLRDRYSYCPIKYPAGLIATLPRTSPAPGTTRHHPHWSSPPPPHTRNKPHPKTTTPTTEGRASLLPPPKHGSPHCPPPKHGSPHWPPPLCRPAAHLLGICRLLQLGQ